MRRIKFRPGGAFLIALSLSGAGLAQNRPARPQSSTVEQQAAQAVIAPAPPNPADVASVDSIIAALYDVISGPAGKKRDWNRMRSLFIPEGRLIPIVPQRAGGYGARVLTVDGYIAASGNYLETNGFFEREIARTAERFGNLVHVFSTYEGRHKLDDPKPFLRGINSIQLMYDGTRWWVVNVSWEAERPDSLLPEKYLKKN